MRQNGKMGVNPSGRPNKCEDKRCCIPSQTENSFTIVVLPSEVDSFYSPNSAYITKGGGRMAVVLLQHFGFLTPQYYQRTTSDSKPV